MPDPTTPMNQIVGTVLFPVITSPEHKKHLIAVSGGSDSMALLHHWSRNVTNAEIIAATVDHGLRPESGEEAQTVARFCAQLGVPHATLHWHPDREQTSSQAARLARYHLLVKHARETEADIILLGHTLDDQAETLLMRARRLKPDSATRGLSGMPQTASYEEIKLLRPLLTIRRERLRDYLREQKINWIDDPTNDKTESERVRMRNRLQGSTALPSASNIGMLATLSRRQRHWLAGHIAEHIRKFVRLNGNNLRLVAVPNAPEPVINEVFLVLVQVCGGGRYRVSENKVKDIVRTFQHGTKTRKAVGNCLVTVSDREALFSREFRISKSNRRVSGKPPIKRQPPAFSSPDVHGPCINALEFFRPASDDCVYEALMGVLNRTGR